MSYTTFDDLFPESLVDDSFVFDKDLYCDESLSPMPGFADAGSSNSSDMSGDGNPPPEPQNLQISRMEPAHSLYVLAQPPPEECVLYLVRRTREIVRYHGDLCRAAQASASKSGGLIRETARERRFRDCAMQAWTLKSAAYHTLSRVPTFDHRTTITVQRMIKRLESLSVLSSLV